MKFKCYWLAMVISASAFANAARPEASLFHLLTVKKPFARIPSKMNEVVPGKILIKYSIAKAAALESRFGPTAASKAPFAKVGPSGEVYHNSVGPSGWTEWDVPKSTDTRALAKTIAQTYPDVRYAEPVFKIYPLQLAPPNDPDFSYFETDPSLVLDLSGDNTDLGFDRMWNLEDINALEGWNTYPGTYFSRTIKPRYAPKLAVIDTGCDTLHPNFINPGGTGTDISQGGQFWLSNSRFFSEGQLSSASSYQDTNGHGTHVSGICLAAANNGPFSSSVDNGIPGVGYNATGMELRVFDNSGDGTDADAAAAIYYAADNGADICNLSLGDTNFSQLFQDAVTYAFQKGVAVFAAGNESGSGGGPLGPIYPAACSGAFAVTAAGPGGTPATDYAGTGNYIQVAAPGGELVTDNTNYEYIQYVWSTEMETEGDLYQESLDGIVFPPYNLNYGYLVGTSMACPHVSGAAALFYAMKEYDRNKGGSNIQTYRAIANAAADVFGVPGGGWETNFGYGYLDINALLLQQNARGSTIGSIDGIVYYNETAIANVEVKAKIDGYTFSTTTHQDGTYRFDSMPPGVATVSCAPFGAPKSKLVIVRDGSDTPGVDFWAGTYGSDTTPPVFKNIGAGLTHTTNKFPLLLWAYDPETGVDKVTFEVGTTPGGSDVLPLQQIVNDWYGRTLQAKLTKGKTYYITAEAWNGEGLSTTASASVVW